MCKKLLTRYSINVILISTSNIIPSYLKFSYNFILVVRLLKRSESEFIMTTKKSVKVDGEFLTSLFETKANEILAKESKKKATKKVVTEKSEVKAEKPKKATKKTVKASKKADTEKVVKDEKITKKPATKKVVKKAEKPAEEQAEKPKKATKKAKAEVEHEQELRKISKSLKVAKTTYKVVKDIKSYEELLKAVEEGREIAVAFDCSEVAKKDYEEIFHVPYVNMKDNFDICEPIFIGEKVPRLVFASIYSEALWDLFTTEFNLISAVLEK